MAVKFDKKIFHVLIKCGFRFCYSKTAVDEQSPHKVSILLTPALSRPDIRKLPDIYDTWFCIKKEPRQMAAGIDGDTSVHINLNDTLLKNCYEQ